MARAARIHDKPIVVTVHCSLRHTIASVDAARPPKSARRDGPPKIHGGSSRRLIEFATSCFSDAMNRIGTIPQDEPLVRVVGDMAVHHFPELEPDASGRRGRAVIASVAFLLGTFVGQLLR